MHDQQVSTLPTPRGEELIDVKHAAKALGMSAKILTNDALRRRIPCTRRGGRIHFSADQLWGAIQQSSLPVRGH